MAEHEGGASDQQGAGAGAEGAKNDFGNFKEEVNRKFGNIKDEIRAQNAEMLKQVAGLVRGSGEPESRQQQSQVPDPIDDPAGYGEYLVGKLSKTVDERFQIFDRVQSTKEEAVHTLSRMSETYPELRKKDSELAKKAGEIFGSLDKVTQESPIGYEVAVQRAAQQLNLVPASMRDNAAFNLSGGGGGGRRPRGDGEISENLEELCNLMGIDLSNKETKARMLKRQKYSAQDWMRYSSGK